MNFTLLVVVLLTAIAFVGIVIALSNAIAPRSYNAQKMEPYECGIPTRGKSWMQFRVGIPHSYASIFCGLYERGDIALDNAITIPTKAIAVSKTTTNKVKFINLINF